VALGGAGKTDAAWSHGASVSGLAQGRYPGYRQASAQRWTHRRQPDAYPYTPDLHLQASF